MIFTSVKNISNKTDKAFFKEKVLLYIRIIECLETEKSSHSFSDQEIISELHNIGVIDNSSDLPLLEKTIGSDLYIRLVKAVQQYLNAPLSFEPYIRKLRNQSRVESQRHHSGIAFADFFCGAGGMSLGFCKAGYDVAIANDIVDECIETYRLNHPETPSYRIIKGDIRQLCDNVDAYIKRPIDVVVGGPPCQGFSSANRQRIIDDPRNELYKYYLRAVQLIAPKFVVMENVKGMLTVADQVVEDYRNIICDVNGSKCNYLVAYRLLNSSDFGVAQNRIRLIYIAIRSDIAENHGITPDTIFENIQSSAYSHKYVLRDALEYIKPLTSPRIKGLTEVDDEQTGKKVDTNHFTETNPYLSLINDNRTMPLVFNHKARYASDTNFQIFSLLQQGEDASDEKIKGIMPYSHRLHCFKDKYYRLIEDKPCRTITAHLKMDCLSHIHPTQTRTITPREAARIQSFPDDYIFMGAYLKTYMQIGNAVPVLMAQTIANVIKKYI